MSKTSNISNHKKEYLRELQSFFDNHSQPNAYLDSIILQSIDLLKAKFAFISFIGQENQNIISSHGAELNHLDPTLLLKAINEEEILIVDNIETDKHFTKVSDSLTAPILNFYAGVPLITSSGYRVGVLSIADINEVKLSNIEVEVLKLLANQIVSYIELNLKDIELLQTNKKFEEVQSISQAGLWELDIKTGFTTWSKEIYKIHAMAEQVPVQKVDAISFYAPHERQRLTSIIQESILNKSSFNGEFEFLDANGVHKWVRSAGYPQLDNDGNVTKLIGTFQDISDIKTVSIREQIIFNQSSDSIMTLSPPNWNFTSANPAALKTFKVKSESDFKKLGPWDLSPELQLDGSISSVKAKEVISIAMDKGTHFFEWTHQDIEGKSIQSFVSLNKVTIHDDVFLQATVRDMTQKFKQEKEHQYILETMRVGTWKWDIPNDDLRWSESNYNVFGIVKGDFKGAYDAWEKTLHPDFKAQAVLDLSIALESSKEYDATFPILLETGEVKYIGARAEITRNRDGKAIQMLGINWDKTKEIMALEEVEKQKKISYHNAKLISLGELAAGVGHEINNPLAIISGHCDLISKVITQEYHPTISNSLPKITDAIGRVTNIVNGLKTFSRSDTEDFSNFNLHDLVTSTVEMMAELYNSEGVSITSNLSKDLYASGNRGRIQQVLVNLITNARDAVATASSKDISISVTQRGSKLSISVSDSGEGIKKELIDKIFDPFFTSKAINSGTGIGLSLCYRIINEHGGELSVDSEVGHGSVFTFELDKGTKQSQSNKSIAPLNQEEVSISEASMSTHILVVEDEEPLRDIISFFLEDMGFTFETVSNGEEALDLFLSKPNEFDFILSDMQMPVMDGATLFKEIRLRKDLKQPKLLLMTGGVNVNFESKTDELGKIIDGFLSKPFKPEEIEEMIKRFLQDKS